MRACHRAGLPHKYGSRSSTSFSASSWWVRFLTEMPSSLWLAFVVASFRRQAQFAQMLLYSCHNHVCAKGGLCLVYLDGVV